MTRSLRIVIAAWHLKDFNVGLGRYCQGLIEAIGRVDRENRYDILMPTNSYRFPERPNIRYRLIRFPLFKRRFWEQVAPWLGGPCDLLHFPYDSRVVWKRGKFVVTIHDVKPLIFGECRERHSLKSVLERLLVRDKWATIDHVLTDSDCSRRDIVERLKVSPDRITVVYPGVELDRFRPISSAQITTPSKPYVLTVAGADPTKNVETLIEAFGRLPVPLRDTTGLVLVGDFRRRQDLRELTTLRHIANRTEFPGVVTEEDLIHLYQNATAFVFPSRYEGFGLPVLEAMACGCPVLSSNASSLPEVTGDAAILFDPMDAQGLAREMERVLTDSELRQDLRERGLARAAQFTWDRMARETITVYKKVAGAE